MDDTTQLIAQVPLWVIRHVPVMVFLFCFGACVGSFLNVVIYRLPAGMSVITPPSRCPTCGARLGFFRENLPIIGWLMIRGKCRYCGVRVSAQYMIIELLMALIFVGLYVVLFMTSQSTPWWGAIGGPWWTANQIFRAWPCYMALAFMIAGLVAMTLIDARTMMIPIEIPLVVTGTAFVAYPLQVLLPHRGWAAMTWPIPGAHWSWCVAAVGGMLGIAVGLLLLRMKVLRYSFADYYDHVEEGETVGDYPHARREMLVELQFLVPVIALFVAGFLIGSRFGPQSPPEIVQAIGATLLGYLSGAALIWGIRILGTFAFGREAMGLGDVHLLGSVGAVLGWFDPILIFFIAPFSGIIWVLVSMGISSVFRTARRELSYGPHLAVATLIVILCRPGIDWLLSTLMPGVPFPQPGFVLAEPAAGDGTRAGPAGGTTLASAGNLSPDPRGGAPI